MARGAGLSVRRSRLSVAAAVVVAAASVAATPAEAFPWSSLFGFFGFPAGGSSGGAAGPSSNSSSTPMTATPSPTLAASPTATPTPTPTSNPTAGLPIGKRDFSRRTAVSLKAFLKGKVPSTSSVVTPAPATGYLAKLFFPSGDRFYCMGSLLTDRHVLTAAHCLVRAGDLVRVGGSTMLDGVERTVGRVEDHPQFAETLLTFNYDAAVLVLDTPITAAEREAIGLRFVKLSGGGFGKPFVGSSASVRSFGLLGVGDSVPGMDNVPSESLLELAHTIKSDDQCEAIIGDGLVGIDDAVHVCASANGRGTSCSGDSGAPLVVERSVFGFIGRWFNAPTEIVSYGVLSFGVTVGNVNCPLDMPTIWTRASVVRPFVEEVVEADGLQLL